MSSLKDIGMPKNIISIDASMNSMAFAYFQNKDLKSYGKIDFAGKDHFEKSGDACRKLTPFLNSFNIESLVIESTIYANSPKTSMQLAMVQGAIMGAAAMNGVKKMHSCVPVAWQSWIGNKVLTKEEKYKIRKDHVGKSESWYKNQEREFRKNRTIKLVNNNFMIDVEDNDVADAIGIGWYSINNWHKISGNLT